jgi:hypothetical protein
MADTRWPMADDRCGQVSGGQVAQPFVAAFAANDLRAKYAVLTSIATGAVLQKGKRS